MEQRLPRMQPQYLVQKARLTKAVRGFQMQCCGVASNMRWPFTTSEFEQMIEAYWQTKNRELGLCVAALTSFQLLMIRMLDHCSKFRLPSCLGMLCNLIGALQPVLTGQRM